MLTTEASRVTYTVLDGSLDMSAVTSARERVASERAGLWVLLDVPEVDLGGIESKAAWEDQRSTKFLDDVDRAALITGSTMLKGAMAAAVTLRSMAVKTCEPGQRDQALLWLQS